VNDNAKKWVAALRSGEFKQTKGRLRDTKGFCCLGVACEVYRRETGNGEWDDDGLFQGTGEVLPRNVLRWLSLSRPNGSGSELGVCLTERNDKGASFAEIADLIESEPDGLFAALDEEA
jgi:hypothetical protein